MVSVIIPFKDRLELVNRAVMSVITQSYKNWELILVDDASTELLDLFDRK